MIEFEVLPATGRDADEHSHLTQRAESLQRLRDAARAAGDESRFLELHVALYNAETVVAEFVGRYLRTSRA